MAYQTDVVEIVTINQAKPDDKPDKKVPGGWNRLTDEDIGIQHSALRMGETCCCLLRGPCWTSCARDSMLKSTIQFQKKWATHVSYQILNMDMNQNIVFQATEPSIPYDKTVEVIKKLRDHFNKSNNWPILPIEIRSVKKDKFWLSGGYERDYTTFDCLQRTQPAFFKEIKPIFDQYEQRPHWGKIILQTPAEVRKALPRFDDFVRLKKKMDPQNRFGNKWSDAFFWIDVPAEPAVSEKKGEPDAPKEASKPAAKEEEPVHAAGASAVGDAGQAKEEGEGLAAEDD